MPTHSHSPSHHWAAFLTSPPEDAGPVRRAVVAIAHPDDETVGLGARLLRLHGATFIYMTDGAPRDLQDARAAGFSTCEAYARARRDELRTAFVLAGLDPVHARFLDLPDQETAYHLVHLTHVMKQILHEAEAELVITHPYEGGHPDHDATAFAVHAACRLCAAEGRPVPTIIEAPYYHNRNGLMTTGDFLPDTGGDIRTLALSEVEQALKRRLIACFLTQAQTLAQFPTDVERFRPAPCYDFERPPHDGPLLYEIFGWGLTKDRWRDLARAALDALELHHTGRRAPLHRSLPSVRGLV